MIGSSRSALLLLGALACAASASCSSDPAREQQIAELGGEDPNVPPGPDHRPGQPCVLCHSDGGPADDAPFAVGGTIYESDKAGASGASGVEVRFIDARGRAPADKVVTSESGNFFVPASAWNVAFPFRVALFKNGTQTAVMTSTVNREGSCNYCHRPANVPSSLPPEERARRFYKQIFAGGS